MVVLYSVIALILGLFLWVAFTPSPRGPLAAEAGRLAYFAGLLVLLFSLAGAVARLLPPSMTR